MYLAPCDFIISHKKSGQIVKNYVIVYEEAKNKGVGYLPGRVMGLPDCAVSIIYKWATLEYCTSVMYLHTKIWTNKKVLYITILK